MTADYDCRLTTLRLTTRHVADLGHKHFSVVLDARVSCRTRRNLPADGRPIGKPEAKSNRVVVLPANQLACTWNIPQQRHTRAQPLVNRLALSRQDSRDVRQAGSGRHLERRVAVVDAGSQVRIRSPVQQHLNRRNRIALRHRHVERYDISENRTASAPRADRLASSFHSFFPQILRSAAPMVPRLLTKAVRFFRRSLSMSANSLVRAVTVIFAVALCMASDARAQSDPDQKWSLDVGLGWDNSFSGNINSSAIGTINNQTTVILKNMYEDVYGTGLHLRAGVGYMVNPSTEARATVAFQSLDADLARLGDYGASNLYGQYADYQSLTLDFGLRRYGATNKNFRPYVEGTIGMGFVDEIEVELVAPQSNLILACQRLLRRDRGFFLWGERWRAVERQRAGRHLHTARTAICDRHGGGGPVRSEPGSTRSTTIARDGPCHLSWASGSASSVQAFWWPASVNRAGAARSAGLAPARSAATPA